MDKEIDYVMSNWLVNFYNFTWGLNWMRITDKEFMKREIIENLWRLKSGIRRNIEIMYSDEDSVY